MSDTPRGPDGKFLPRTKGGGISNRGREDEGADSPLVEREEEEPRVPQNKQIVAGLLRKKGTHDRL